jgi:(p)ppGpp synthase/HD superfamily hydrolase
MPHLLAQCCTPHFPAEVVAVIRSGGKCMVHTNDCKSLKRVNPARLLPAYWSGHEIGIVVPLIIIMQDRPGFLADITKALYQT